MRPRERREALERIGRLAASAARHASSDPRLARNEMSLARRISSGRRVRMPPPARALRCRRCKSLSVPGVSARVRVGRSGIRAVRTTCLLCGEVRRVPLGARKSARRAAGGRSAAPSGGGRARPGRA